MAEVWVLFLLEKLEVFLIVYNVAGSHSASGYSTISTLWRGDTE